MNSTATHDRSADLKHEAIFNRASQLTWILSGDGLVQEANQPALIAAGVCEAQVIGRRLWETPGWTQCVTQQDRVKLAIQRANFGERDHFRTQYHGANGDCMHVDFTIMPVMDGDDEIQFLVANARDMTELHFASERLRISEERFVLATRASGDGIWDWDLLNDNLWFSPRYREILGFAANDRIRFPDDLKAFIDHLHPDDKEQTFAAFTRCRDDGEMLDIEFRMKTKDGNWIWIRSRGDCQRDETGQAIRMTGSHQDINEEKLLAQKLLESNQDLERFAYAASHDLREPLRTVAGYCDLLLEVCGEALGEEGRQFAGSARSGALRMDQLICDLMNYSRLSQQELVRVNCSSNEIIQNALSHLTAKISETRAVVKIGDDLPELLGDPTLLELLFQNLIANAIKFTKPNEVPRLEITGQRLASGDLIRIKDFGIGMDAASTQKIFDVFYRLHNHERYEGTGIGLAICKRVADRHGATISVESEPGVGSEFTIHFPPFLNVFDEGTSGK